MQQKIIINGMIVDIKVHQKMLQTIRYNKLIEMKERN